MEGLSWVIETKKLGQDIEVSGLSSVGEEELSELSLSQPAYVIVVVWRKGNRSLMRQPVQNFIN